MDADFARDGENPLITAKLFSGPTASTSSRNKPTPTSTDAIYYYFFFFHIYPFFSFYHFVQLVHSMATQRFTTSQLLLLILLLLPQQETKKGERCGKCKEWVSNTVASSGRFLNYITTPRTRNSIRSKSIG